MSSDLEQVHIVACGLVTLIDRALNKLQGINAFGVNYPQRIRLSTEEDWYSLAYDALLQGLALDIACITDRAKYREDSNCSFKELKYLLEKRGDEQRYQKVKNEVNTLIEDYSDIILDTLRNKTLAHKDLEQFFKHEDFCLDLPLITRFLNQGYMVVSDVLEIETGVKLFTPDLDSKQKKYEDSLKRPLQHEAEDE